MNDLFNIFNKTQCKSMGICSENPVLLAVDAVVINEIRQIAYYIVKLKELNLINEKIMKEAVLALSVSITDTSFNKNAFVKFFMNLKNLKKETEDFYTAKCKEMGINYEHLAAFPIKENEKINSSLLIKQGEKIISHFFGTLSEDKIRLFDLIIFMAKAASCKILELENYKEVQKDEYFEILRFLSLANSFGTRYEKLVRRIKEFSSFLYKLIIKCISSYRNKKDMIGIWIFHTFSILEVQERCLVYLRRSLKLSLWLWMMNTSAIVISLALFQIQLWTMLITKMTLVIQNGL